MSSTGLIILTQPVSHLRGLIPKVIEEAAVIVSDTLYVCLQPGTANRQSNSTIFLNPVNNTKEIQSFAKDFYIRGANICHHLDVRILLSHICKQHVSISTYQYSLKKRVSVLMSDSVKLRDLWNDDKAVMLKQLKTAFTNINDNLRFSFLNLGNEEQAGKNPEQVEDLKTYPNVVIGGTFDRLHSGHKLLLTESCLRTESKLTVGITDGERNKKKVIWELMEPYEVREQNVVDFVNDVKPSIIMEPAQIFDPFGPTITDPDLQCIVVSEETKAGGVMVNEERQKRVLGEQTVYPLINLNASMFRDPDKAKSIVLQSFEFLIDLMDSLVGPYRVKHTLKAFPVLDMVVIDLVDDTCAVIDKEDKVSSSSLRRRLLGTLHHPIKPRPHISQMPYRIGVTGGIASGKSNICKELESLGAKKIDCDRLGHETYVKGTPVYHTIIKEFGLDIIQENGEINRQKLGSIVFADKAKLNKLNSIVWPAIRDLAEEKIKSFQSDGEKIVVLEAAVMLEAGWDNMVHEVWTAFIPREEAVKRLMNRNKLDEAEAQKRLDSQISNSARIAQSNVVFCPLWEFEYTRQQIERAWNLLQNRIKVNPSTKL